jgi:flagellar biosynthesis protein FlhB
VERPVSTGEEKRFEPTPSRLRRAQREGNATRSVEVSSIAAFGAAIFAASAALPIAASGAATAIRDAARGSFPSGTGFGGLGAVALGALLPAAAAAAAGTFAGLVQGGGLHLTGVHADLKRLSPFAGLKRMAGAEALIAVVRAALAFVVALAAMIPLASEVVARGASLGSPHAAAALVASAALRACIAALAVGAAFAVADYALAGRRRLRGLRMSFEELRRDTKENDGDPQSRARRKTAHRALARGSVGRTREASFVVVNPTHVAVGLRYAPPAVPVPEIVVRAQDDAALRVRAIAREHRIPVIEDVGLARLLFARGEGGRPIPPDAYVAVAQIVAALARAGLFA